MGRCRTFDEHEWGSRRFLETGRHPTMGWFRRYTVTCARCDRRTTETEWLSLTAAKAAYEGGMRESHH